MTGRAEERAGLLRRRAGFRRLFVANVVSMAGDWLTYVAVGVLALGAHATADGSLADVALVQLAHTLPQVASAPLAGWLSDRVDRRRLVVVASIVRGLLTAGMALAAAHGEIRVVELLLFARMAGASLVTTPISALVPRLVAEDEITDANALLGLAWAIVFSLGVAAGGVVSALLGPVSALALDALTFFAAAALFATLRVPPARAETRRAALSLLGDVRLHPARLSAALLKVPAQLVSGAAFVAMHALVAVLAPAHVALALGALHALRGVGNGAAPWLLRRRMEPAPMASAGSALAIAGAALLALAGWLAGAPAIACAVVAALVWGAGVGASWVGGGAALQRAVPDAVLGRYAALDLTAAALASAAGGVACALLAPRLDVPPSLAAIAVVSAILALAMPRLARRALPAALALGLVALPSPPATAPPTLAAQAIAAGARPASLADELRARAITDEDFARTELYTWTTREQAARLAAGAPLLWATAADGALRSPYQRALDELAAPASDAAARPRVTPDADDAAARPRAAPDADDAALARALTSHPALAARRYAWTTPYGTAVPLGVRGYGPVLVRIELRADAWHARFAPDERPAFRVVDGRGAPVTIAAVLAAPARLATVYHARARSEHGAFRELVVHGGVASFSAGTAAIAERVRADRRVLATLRRWVAAHPSRRRAMAPRWASPPAPDASPVALFAATMPFDTPRHRPTDAALAAMIRALAPRARVAPFEHGATSTAPGE